MLVQRPQSESAEETTKLLSSERPISGDSIFDTKSSLVGSGILKKRRAQSAKDLYSVGRDSDFYNDEDYVATPQKPFRGYISWKVCVCVFVHAC